jgi:hypothetical protein
LEGKPLDPARSGMTAVQAGDGRDMLDFLWCEERPHGGVAGAGA